MPFVLTAAVLIVLLTTSTLQAGATSNCHIGSYRLSNGEALDIAPSDGDNLRWRLFNGETGKLTLTKDGSWTSTFGWTDRADGKVVSFSACEKGDIVFGKLKGHKINFDVNETTFDSNGTKLVGRLVMPQKGAKVPVVVLVHGSENDSARDFYSLQRMLPAEGIGAFVYDKRGTGSSGSKYTQDFEVLANDAVAAMKEARRLAGVRAGRVGYQGGSQGGWVVPLAANRAPVDFAVVSFGLAVTVLEEDQECVVLDMQAKGHSAENTAKALELARAGERVFETMGKEGYAEFDALRKKYQSEPWYKDVRGNFLFMVLPLNAAKITELVSQYFAQTPFRYEPMPTLRASTTPQLWILGADDRDAPSAETARRIKTLIKDGKPYTLAVYPSAEHGLTEYELMPNGTRVSTRYAPDYFKMMADFIRDGRMGSRYGKAEIVLSGSR